jgi:hypothetical protein
MDFLRGWTSFELQKCVDQLGYYCPTPAKVKLARYAFKNDLLVEVAVNGGSSRKGNLRTLRMPGAARKGLSVGYSQLRHPFHRCAATATTPFRH